MTDESADVGAFIRDDPADLSTRPTMQRECDGCRALTERVAQLEQTIADWGDAPMKSGVPTLKPTHCYWITVGVHAFCLFVIFANEDLMLFSLMGSVGVLATLVVTQALSTRPIYLRVLSSFLAFAIVTTAAFLSIWAGHDAGITEMIAYLLMLFPPVFAIGWFTAKLFVWIGGYKILLPSDADKRSRLQIQHLMLFTLLIALYLGSVRMMVGDVTTWMGDYMWTTLAYACVPTIVCTVVACMLARILLSDSTRLVPLRCVLLAVGMNISIMSLVLVLSVVVSLTTGEWETLGWEWETLVALLTYSIPMSIAVFASAGGTFLLMRQAGYRLVSRSRPLTTT